MEKKLWFKAKTYGWGWTPSTWEGWALVVGFLVVVYGAEVILVRYQAQGWSRWAYLGIVAVAIGMLLATCVRKGEKPSWRWGKK